jgi:TRAP-type C4-dicarboxylate transport system permease small subunit
MNAAKILALVLIAAGVLGLVYGGFTYTKDTHEANVGPLNISIKDKETVNIPIWAGVVAVVIGGGLLVFASKKS